MTEASASTPTARPVRLRLVLALLALAAAGLYFQGELGALGGMGFPLDDSWIHLQFAKNLAAGQGLSYNPGVASTGSTAPLWTALLALGFLVPGGAILVSKLLGVALHLVAVDASYVLARRLGLSQGLAALAGLLTLATYWLVWSALSGMEIPLFLALSLWGTNLHLAERRDPSRLPAALPVIALSALARPEGLLLLALAVADRLLIIERGEDGLRLAVPPWRQLAIGLGLAALALLPTLLYYQVVGGSMFPSTFAVKAQPQVRWPNLRFLHTLLGIYFKPHPWLTLAGATGLVRLAERAGTREDRGLLPGLWLLAFPVAYSTLAAPGATHLFGNFGRYFFPLFPTLVVLGCLGIEPVFRLFAARWRPPALRLGLAGVLLAALVAPTVVALFGNVALYTRNVTNITDGDVRLGLEIATHVPPQAVVALEDIGAVKFLAPNPILDIVGLVSPAVRKAVLAAQSDADPFGQRGLEAVLAEARPDFLAMFSNYRPTLVADTSRWRPLLVINVRDNITLAGDQIVLYATPWCRYPETTFPQKPSPTP